MDESMYDLYLAYKGKLIDDDFLNKVFDLMIQREPCLTPYVSDFNISNEESKNRGTFTPRDGKITIYKNMINSNPYGMQNIVGIETVRHELEHARNVRKLDERKEDIESRILRASASLDSHIMFLEDTRDADDLDLLAAKCIKFMNLDFEPDERLAKIRGWKYVVNLLKSQYDTPDISFARHNLLHSYRRGYSYNGYYLDCPTYTYLLNTGQVKDLRSIKNSVDKKGYIFDTRLLYGLPLLYKEYDDGTLDKVLLQKKSI